MQALCIKSMVNTNGKQQDITISYQQFITINTENINYK